MNKSIYFLFFLFWCWAANAAITEPPYENRVATNPRINVFPTGEKTQITYTNGSEKNPEYFIMLCDPETNSVDVQYYIISDGFQITKANYFTIQRYPINWLKMTPPYHSPSVVIYDSGMGLGKNQFINAITRLMEPGDWGIVFTFETFVNDHNIITQAWSEIIPSYVFRRDLYETDLSACVGARSRNFLPLIRFNNENR